MDCVTTSLQMKIECFFSVLDPEKCKEIGKIWKILFGGPGDGSPKFGVGEGTAHASVPQYFASVPQCNREKFKGKMTKKVVRNSENVDIFGGPRTETKFVKWSATRKRLRTAALQYVLNAAAWL